jgi:hypothetical protein
MMPVALAVLALAAVLLITAMLVLPVLGGAGVRQLWGWMRRPRPRACPSCGYDLTGNTTGVCPECGVVTRPGP